MSRLFIIKAIIRIIYAFVFILSISHFSHQILTSFSLRTKQKRLAGEGGLSGVLIWGQSREVSFINIMQISKQAKETFELENSRIRLNAMTRRRRIIMELVLLHPLLVLEFMVPCRHSAIPIHTYICLHQPKYTLWTNRCLINEIRVKKMTNFLR